MADDTPDVSWPAPVAPAMKNFEALEAAFIRHRPRTTQERAVSEALADVLSDEEYRRAVAYLDGKDDESYGRQHVRIREQLLHSLESHFLRQEPTAHKLARWDGMDVPELTRSILTDSWVEALFMEEPDSVVTDLVNWAALLIVERALEHADEVRSVEAHVDDALATLQAVGSEAAGKISRFEIFGPDLAPRIDLCIAIRGAILTEVSPQE